MLEARADGCLFKKHKQFIIYSAFNALIRLSFSGYIELLTAFLIHLRHSRSR